MFALSQFSYDHSLNSYGYDNLILHVEFAKPRAEDGAPAPSAGSQGALSTVFDCCSLLSPSLASLLSARST
jgi:hypothetical protein